MCRKFIHLEVKPTACYHYKICSEVATQLLSAFCKSYSITSILAELGPSALVIQPDISGYILSWYDDLSPIILVGDRYDFPSVSRMMSIILGPQNRHISQIFYLNQKIVPVGSWIQSYHDQLKKRKATEGGQGILEDSSLSSARGSNLLWEQPTLVLAEQMGLYLQNAEEVTMLLSA